MIFVTVGTHEQPFNRLIQKVDELKRDGIIKDDVIIQTGFSTYEPKYCQWSKLIPYQQMVKNVADARIVITHGGPASFIMPLQIGKTPIVVPRQHQYNEHVNDHQVEFARNVAQRMGTIIPVEDINTLGDVITNYDQIVASMGHGMSSNNAKFNLRPIRQSFKHRSSLSGIPLPLLVRKQSRMKIFKTSCRMNTTFSSKPNVGVIAICHRNGTSSYRSVLWEKAAKENF